MTRRFSADEQVKCFSLLCPLLCGLPVLSALDAESKAVHMQSMNVWGKVLIGLVAGGGGAPQAVADREPDATQEK